MKITPLLVFLLYLFVICLCAILYFSIPNVFENDIGLGDSLYFSVVTITTLGYGDYFPISDVGKIIAGVEALSGIMLTGIFLFVVTNRLVEKQERKRVDAAKLNLKAQYNAWKRDVIFSLLFLSEANKGVSTELAAQLLDVDRFREHFNEDNDRRWRAIINNLSSDNYYCKEIIHSLENLQNHIEIFLTIVRTDHADVLRRLTQYVNHLRILRRQDLDHCEDQKVFMRALWALLAQWDIISGYHGDILLDAIDKV